MHPLVVFCGRLGKSPGVVKVGRCRVGLTRKGSWKLLHGAVRGLFKFLATVGMLIFLLAAWATYRISQGPLSLSHLTPFIEQALSLPDSRIAVKIGDTVLTLNRESYSLQIRAERVHVSSNGVAIAAFPEMTVSLSGRALLHGRLVPREIALLHPALHLSRDAEGAISFDMTGASDVDPHASSAPPDGVSMADAAFAALLAPPGSETLAGQLQSIRIVDGSLMVDDRLSGLRWTAPRADFTVTRDQRGIAIKAALDLEFDGQPGHLEGEGLYRQIDHVLDAALSGRGLRPASLAKLSPSLALFGAAQFPVGGSVSVSYRFGEQGAGRITAFKADLSAGAGALDLTGLSGFRLPLASASLRADLDGNRLTLQSCRVDLNGSVLTADGSVDGLAGDRRGLLRVQIDGVALDRLQALWPKPVAPNPRAWIVANLTQGRIEAVDATLTAHLPAGQELSNLTLDSVSGRMAVNDATVRYVAEMPPVKHVDAIADFDADHFDIALTKGDVAGLSLVDGKAVLEGLSKQDQDAIISLKIAGSVSNILRFIDNPPLHWTGKLGVKAETVQGDAQVILGLDFPLVEQLTFDQLRLKAEADSRGLGVPHVLKDLDLTDGSLHFSIDNAGLDAVGSGQIDNRPASIAWRENFIKAAFQSRYQVAAQLSDQGRHLAGLDSVPFQPPYVSGVIPVKVIAVRPRTGRYDIAVTADLSSALIVLPGLNYRKPPGLKASGSTELHLSDNKLTDLLQFHVQGADNLDVKGDLAFADGLPLHLSLQRGNWARTAISGTVDFRMGDGGLIVQAGGPSFDAREILASQPSDPLTDRAPDSKPRQAAPRDAADQEVTPLSITGNYQQVWLSDDGSIEDVAAALERDHHQWRVADITGKVGDHKSLSLRLAPVDEHHSRVTGASGDSGALLRAMNLFDTMGGGTLALAAESDDANPQRPLDGTLKIDDFQLIHAPVLAQLLSIAGLTGIGDLLSGQGIHFAKLEVPFFYQAGVLQLYDGQAAGNALGITAKGRVDLENGELALEGTLVPAYVINSALGGLPLVGGLFAPEPGGGLLAINYQVNGPSDHPSLMVNPLSALTPGFLRRFFDLFGAATDRPPTAR